jgi:peptidoglycan/xylan/chitin deacetylase (PgdA/CDA1 family)
MSTSNRRLSVCLSFDFDAMSAWIAMGSNNPADISRGEFGPFAIPRILALLERHGIQSTFFIPGHTAEAYPKQVKAILAAGHEAGHHGWVHENPAELDLDAERQAFERGLEALDRVAGVRPVIYRSPGAAFSVNTIDVLREFGIKYDSTLAGADFTPYYLRQGDKWSTTDAYEFGETTDLVELPFTWHLDDFTHFEFEAGFTTDQSPPSAVREIWQGEFDYAYANVPGGVYVLCMHPQVIGRGYRLTMLETLIEHFEAHEGVVFESLGNYAQRWAADNPVDKWLATNPVHAGASSRTALQR